MCNFVNFAGYVESPVRLETNSEGEEFVATVISHGNEGTSQSCPVVFKGDLAYAVSRCVKEKDCIIVCGSLRGHPLGWSSSESCGKFHVAARHMRFVWDFERSGLSRKMGADEFDDDDEKEDSIDDRWIDLEENPQQWWDYRGHKSNGLVKENFPDFKHKVTRKCLRISSAPEWILPELEKLEFDVRKIKPKKASKPELDGKKMKPKKASKPEFDVKEMNPKMASEPEFDVKEMKPEKASEPEFDVKEMNPEMASDLEFDGIEVSWNDLVENRGKWRDIIARKTTTSPDLVIVFPKAKSE